MFNQLSKQFSKILEKISNKGIITEKNIKNTLRKIRLSLLEADVALSVVKQFIQSVQLKSLGKKINTSLTPGQEFIKIIQYEMIKKLGKNTNILNFSRNNLSVFLFIGTPGVGKTTSLAKIGKLILTKYKKKILCVSTDINRLAAIKQLELLALKAKIDFTCPPCNKSSQKIVISSLEYAKNNFYEVLLIDTAGRLHTNEKSMLELQEIYKIVNPIETLLIVDSMVGQDSINIIHTFNKFVNLTGVILTKLDSDARGGIALSIKELTNQSIKFIGNGETLESIDIFNPTKIAKRILGMEDVLTVIKEITNKIKISQKKILDNKNHFDLSNFLTYINQIRKVGGLSYLIQQLPTNRITNNISNSISDKELSNFSAIINSMTPRERKNPDIIKNSRKRRISFGSGTSPQNINKLLKQFNIVKNVIKKMKKIGLSKSIKHLISSKF